MTIRKFISLRLFTMLLMLCIASCSLNKDFQLNDTKANNNYAKHLSHSGKFGRCSLCNNLALENQSTDSAVMPLAIQPVEQEQIFASNAAQENIILKPSKYNLAESFENFENSSSIGESESIINKKSSSYKFQQQSKPESSLWIILFFLVLLFLLIAPITLIYLIVKAIKSRKVKKSAKKQKAEIFAILGLILAIMTLVFVIGSS